MKVLRDGLRIARREMRGGVRGFGIFLLCLLPGVVAVGSIGVFAAAVQAGLLQDARALLGGDLEIRLLHRGATIEERAFLGGVGALSEVTELRAMPFSADSGNRVLAEIKAVDAQYPMYGVVRLMPDLVLEHALAADRAGIWGGVAEQALLDRLDIAVGSVVEVGGIRVAIRARLVEEPDRSLAGFTLGPRLMISQDALSASGLAGEESLARHLLRLAWAESADAGAVAAYIQGQFPDAGWRIRTWQQAEPRVRDFLERMAFHLTLVGLCALLAGGVGVHGAVSGYLQGKIHHIATLKCMGATGGVVLCAYLIQIVLMALLAILIGCGVAAIVPWVADLFVGHLLPIRAGFYPVPLVTAALFGVLTALLFSLLALGGARGVPAASLFRGYALATRKPIGWDILLVMGALLVLLIGLSVLVSAERILALWFAGGALLVFGVFRLFTSALLHLARLLRRPPWAPARLALAAIQRPGSPAGGIVFALGLGLTTLVILAQVQANLDRLVLETLPQDAPAFFVMDIQGDQAEALIARVSQYEGVVRVDHSPVLRGRITSIKGVPVREATIDPGVRWAVRGDRFITYRAALPEGNQIVRGAWWEADATEPLVSITADLGAGLGLQPGDTLGVNVLGRELEAVVANWRSVDWSSLQLNFALVFHPSALAGAPASWLASVHSDGADEGHLFREITTAFPNVTVIGTRDVLAQAARTINRIGLAFRAVAGVALLAGFLVLAGAVAADQRRRIREAVIAKVCGATRRDLMLALVAEFGLLAVAGLVLSLLVGSVAGYGIIRGLMKMEYGPALGRVFGVLLPGLVGVVLIGIAGTWHVLGQRPARHLREE